MRAMQWIAIGLAALALSANSAAATEEPAGSAAAIWTQAPVVTHHTGTFNGKRIAYTATVAAIDVPTPDGKGGARVVGISYIADKQRADPQRPVLFLFNGGPIAASFFVHMGMFGPRRLAIPEDLAADPSNTLLTDNPYSPLDVADLVFIDPASTGFSHVLPGTKPQTYATIEADGQQVAGYIAKWLADHNRTDAPVYIFGESYGTLRAPEVARQLAAMQRPIQTAGILLLGQALNIIEIAQRPANIVSYVVSLPTLTATAWYHDKIDHGQGSFDAVMRDAGVFARTDYLNALAQGNRLPDSEKRRIATRLEALTGIAADYYLEHDLRITKEVFRGELLKDRGLLLGRNDSRYTAPLTGEGVAPDPFMVVLPVFDKSITQYLRDELKVSSPQPYTLLALTELDQWGWSYSSPFASYAYPDMLTKLFQANPKFRLFVGNGYYDTQTTVGAAAYLLDQNTWPSDRVSLHYYQGGHAAYTALPAAKALGADVRSFMTQGH